MIVYHSTSARAADAIDAEGFVGGVGSYLTANTYSGVWVSDVPLDSNDHGNFEATEMFEIDVPAEVSLDQWEWIEDGKPYREWMLPASELNRFPRRRLSEDELDNLCRHTYSAFLEREGQFWLVRVPETGSLTQARNLEEAEQMAREVISLDLDVPLENINVVVRNQDGEPPQGEMPGPEAG